MRSVVVSVFVATDDATALAYLKREREGELPGTRVMSNRIDRSHTKDYTYARKRKRNSKPEQHGKDADTVDPNQAALKDIMLLAVWRPHRFIPIQLHATSVPASSLEQKRFHIVHVG